MESIKSERLGLRLTEADLHYFAGFFDGEGTAGIYGAGSTCVRISNTHLPILESFQEAFGGKIEKKQCRDSEKHRTAYQWRLAKHEQIVFLSMLLPYLREKRAQCLLLLASLEMPASTRGDIADQLKLMKRRDYQ